VTDADPAAPDAPRRRSPSARAWLDAACWAAVLLPLAVVAEILLLAVTCRARYGAWPYPYHPDPKDIALPAQLELIYLSLPFAVVAPVFLLCLLVARRAAPAPRVRADALALCACHALSYAAFWVFVKTNDHHLLIEWLMD